MTVRRSSLKELATALDLSIATVSRALAGHPNVSESARSRVAAKAAELGYVANHSARALVSGRSGFAGFVLAARWPHLVDTFLGEFITGLGEGLVARGSDLMIGTTIEGQSELTALKRLVEGVRVDGMILNRIAETDERVDYLRRAGVPFVTHGRVLEPGDNGHWLDSDGQAAFAEAFEMLYALGHRRFALLSIDEPMTFRRYREAGLHEAIASRGDPEVSLTVVTAPRFDHAGHRRNCRKLMTAAPRPTAVLALYDDLALTMLETAATAGIGVPDQLSVIGFDNVTTSAFVRPGLTTFDQDIRNSALRLAGMLMTAIRDRPETAITELIRPKLIVRASHGPAPS